MLDSNLQFSPSQSLRDFGIAQRATMLAVLVICVVGNLTHTSIYDNLMFTGAAMHIVGHAVNGDRGLPPWFTPLVRLAGSLIVGVYIFKYIEIFSNWLSLPVWKFAINLVQMSLTSLVILTILCSAQDLYRGIRRGAWI